MGESGAAFHCFGESGFEALLIRDARGIRRRQKPVKVLAFVVVRLSDGESEIQIEFPSKTLT